MHHHGNNDKWGSHTVDVVTGSCNIIVAFILSNSNIFNWGLNQPLPDDRRSVKLWRPANQRGRHTSWCRCLPGDTLKDKRHVVNLTHRDGCQMWTAALGWPACWRTCDAFLQALVEPTQADLVQQTGMEVLEGFRVFQTCQDYVDVLSRALCGSGVIKHP